MKYHRMKEIATDLMEVAENTGFEYEILADCFEDLIAKGKTPEAAMELIRKSFK